MQIRFALLVTCCFLLVTSETYAISKEKLNDRIERYNNYLEEVMEIPETAVPSKLLKSCKGILIMRQYKAGFIFGAKGGAGVALKRDKETGKWSAPTFVANTEGSFGFQIGGQAETRHRVPGLFEGERFYGGVSFEGGIITQDNRANKKFYGRKVTVKEIFKGEVEVPEEANELINTLERYCN